MKNINKNKQTHNTRNTSKGGFTLVELVVAAVLMLIAVAAIVAVVRTSTDIQVTDYYRRQARAMIMNEFETTFAYNRFGAYTFNAESISDADLQAAPSDSLSFTPMPIIVGDPAGDGKDGEMIVEIWRTEPNINGANVPMHNIKITVWWDDVTGRDTVMLTKELVSFQ